MYILYSMFRCVANKKFYTFIEILVLKE